MSAHDPVTIGLVATSDRASQGLYRDEGIPALEDWLAGALVNPVRFERRLIPDDRATIEATLVDSGRKSISNIRRIRSAAMLGVADIRSSFRNQLTIRSSSVTEGAMSGRRMAWPHMPCSITPATASIVSGSGPHGCS